jgi:4-hydroxy-tetrahydrodipicolinate reductase
MAIKVIQWATGGVGLWSLRKIIDHPDLELVGVLVYTKGKDGVDAGKLCGRPKTGVKATLSKKEIIAMDADVVIMTPKLPEDDDLIALLRSGKDVISPLSYFCPEVEGDALMQRIGDACRAGGSTLHGAGIDPGFVCDRVPAVLTGVCAEVEQINMIEVFDCSKHPLADMMFNLLGFGKGPEDIHLSSPGGLYFSQRLFPSVLYKLARQLGVKLDKVEMDNVQFAFAAKDFEIAAGRVGEGKIAGLGT